MIEFFGKFIFAWTRFQAGGSTLSNKLQKNLFKTRGDDSQGVLALYQDYRFDHQPKNDRAKPA